MKNIIILLAVLAVCSACCTRGEKPTGTAYSVAHEENCKGTNEEEIKKLFDRWNDSLSKDSQDVVANYAVNSTLLPTMFVSGVEGMLTTESQKKEYFKHFLEKQPKGKITDRQIYIGCNTAVDTGLYTFTFSSGVPPNPPVNARYTFTYDWDGKQWLITSHHSSKVPEKDRPASSVAPN